MDRTAVAKELLRIAKSLTSGLSDETRDAFESMAQEIDADYVEREGQDIRVDVGEASIWLRGEGIPDVEGHFHPRYKKTVEQFCKDNNVRCSVKWWN